MIFIPLVSMKNHNINHEKLNLINNNINIKSSENNYFRILDTSTNQILKIPEKEFLYSVVASEMPALFESEALKSQAVASYTYFCKKRQENINKKYDFEINTEKSLNYITEQELRKKWGDNYDKYYEKIKNCVDSVYPEVLKYNNNLILSVYHAISSGTTEKSQDVFGQDLDYLTNINSPGDYLAKNYEVTLEISPQEFKNKIIKSKKDCKFDDNNIQNWARDYVRTSGGMIKEITIGSEKFTGKQIREIFELRSANFEIIYNSETNKFNIITHGYGHGVGLSQNGAQYFAQNNNYDYKQILSTYYPGAEITKNI